MVSRLLNAFGHRAARSQPPRPRLFLDKAPEVIYAVGDVHGCYDLLTRLEQQIADNAARFPGDKWIVMLGDYVDRGPRSSDVIHHLMGPPPPDFTRYCLAGNHEQLMLSYLERPDPEHAWLSLGGRETLHSYGIRQVLERQAMQPVLARQIPAQHVEFIRRAPSLISVPGFVFVHAGLRPEIPLSQQSEQDMLWIRPDDDLAPSSTKLLTVHGHTPVPAVEARGGRINIDTGAFATGILSSVRILRNGRVSHLSLH
jgi:serine/threonine protein phosphatase 1